MLKSIKALWALVALLLLVNYAGYFKWKAMKTLKAEKWYLSSSQFFVHFLLEAVITAPPFYDLGECSLGSSIQV